jgi:hypothetical protein
MIVTTSQVEKPYKAAANEIPASGFETELGTHCTILNTSQQILKKETLRNLSQIRMEPTSKYLKPRRT